MADGRAAGDRQVSTETTSGSRGMGAVFPYVPLGLALIAEASWIAVIAGLLDAFTLHEPVTGVPELLLAAVAGVVASRALGPRLGDRWSRVAVALAALAGLIGWLTSPNLVGSPGGWLAGVAFVRGMAHARLPVDPQRIGTLLAVGVPGLAVAAILGGMVTEPWRGDFREAAQAQVLLFLVTGVSALALARLGEAGAGARIDARRNPAWLMLLGGLVLAATALAIWVGATAGSTIATIAAALVVPLLVVGFVAGFDRRTLRILMISVVVMGALGFIIRTLTAGGAGFVGGTVPPAIPPAQGNPQAQTGLALGLLAVVLIAALLGVMLLAGLWLRRRGGDPVDEDEDRVIDRGGELDAPRRRTVRRFARRRHAPTDAVGAYLALLASLEGRDPVARAAGETPTEHARRLRQAGHGAFPLDLLAADVGLVRFAGLTLGPGEDRKAVARAERARRALLLVPVERPEAAPAGVTAPTGPVTRGGRRAQGPGADMLGAEDPGTFGSILTRIRRGP